LERIEEGFFTVSVSGGGGGEGREDACGGNSTTAGGDGISSRGASCITTGGDFLRRSCILCSISILISSDSAKIAKQTSGSVLYQRTHSERHSCVCERDRETERQRFAPVGSALEDNEAAAKACVDKAMSVTMALLVITPVLVLSSDCAFDFFRCADAAADPPLEARIGGMLLYRCSSCCNNTLFLVRNGELLLLLLTSRKLKRAEEEEHGCRQSLKKLIPDAIVRNLDPRPDCEARWKT
jgi:hypothetical protein